MFERSTVTYGSDGSRVERCTAAQAGSLVTPVSVLTKVDWLRILSRFGALSLRSIRSCTDASTIVAAGESRRAWMS